MEAGCRPFPFRHQQKRVDQLGAAPARGGSSAFFFVTQEREGVEDALFEVCSEEDGNERRARTGRSSHRKCRSRRNKGVLITVHVMASLCTLLRLIAANMAVPYTHYDFG